MQLANNYSIEVKNYSRKTPVTLKLIADILLMLIPVAETAKISCPEFPGKEWVFWGLITFFSLFKIVSKFVAENAEVTD
jgi:hypothetical protein